MAEGDDRFSNLPEAVRKQAEAADAMLRGDHPSTGTPPLTIHNPDLRSEAPAPTIDLQAPQHQPRPSYPDPNNQTWESRYRVLQGKYDAEVPALHQQVRDLQKTISGLNAYVQTLQAQEGSGPQNAGDRQPADAPRTPASLGELKPLDPEDFAGYGEEMAAMVTLNNRLIEELSRLRGQTDSVFREVTENKDERFLRELAHIVPQWRSINADQRWLQWLNQADLMSGIRRQDLLDRHRQAFDVKKVAGIFTRFMEEMGMRPDTSRPGGGETRQFFEPPDAGTAPELPRPPGQQGPAITRAQYKRASEDLALRRITQSDFDRISNQFQADIAAGRVQ